MTPLQRCRLDSFGLIQYSWKSDQLLHKDIIRYLRQATGGSLDYEVLPQNERGSNSTESDTSGRVQPVLNSLYVQVGSSESFFLLLLVDYSSVAPSICISFYIRPQKSTTFHLSNHQLRYHHLESLQELRFKYQHFKTLNLLLKEGTLQSPKLKKRLRVVNVQLPKSQKRELVSSVQDQFSQKGLINYTVLSRIELSDGQIQILFYFESTEQAQRLATFINAYPPFHDCRASISEIRIAPLSLLLAHRSGLHPHYDNLFEKMLSQTRASAVVSRKAQLVRKMMRSRPEGRNKSSNIDFFKNKIDALETKDGIIPVNGYRLNIMQSTYPVGKRNMISE